MAFVVVKQSQETRCVCDRGETADRSHSSKMSEENLMGSFCVITLGREGKDRSTKCTTASILKNNFQQTLNVTAKISKRLDAPVLVLSSV